MVMVAISVTAIAESSVPSLRVGVLVSLSGPSRSWGEVNVLCAKIGAALINDNGGIVWQGRRRRIELLIEDDEQEADRARVAAQKLIEQNVLWVIGPNVATTTQAVQPLFEKAKIPHISYSFSRDLYGVQHPYTLLGMSSSFQIAPALFDLLRNRLHVQRLSFLVRESDEGLAQVSADSHIATTLGMQVLHYDNTARSFPSYRSREGRDARRAAESIAKLRPDAVILAGATPESAPRVVRFLRDVNYAGLIIVTTAIDEAQWRSAERESEGIISVANHWNSAVQSNYFREFRRRYLLETGSWHNEATTKAYAMETIAQFLRFAEQQQQHDPVNWPALLDQFVADDPFVSSTRTLRLHGKDSLGLPRLLAAPTVLAQLRRGHYRPIASIDVVP